MRAVLQPGFILSSRPYQNTSLLLDVFTQMHGRVGMIAKGARTAKVARKALLQPFKCLLLSFNGRSELMLLTAVEPAKDQYALKGKSSYCGFYINELIARLLPRHDPYESLYDSYEATIIGLMGEEVSTEILLRTFELELLTQLGYGLSLESDAKTHEPISMTARYYYDPEYGPFEISEHSEYHSRSISGRSLVALHNKDFSDSACLLDMKTLMRTVINHHLGGRPLKSRELFQ